MALTSIAGNVAELQQKILAMRNDPEIQRRAKLACESADRLVQLQAQEKIDKVRSMSLVGERFQDRTFANFEVTEKNKQAHDKAREIAKNPKIGGVFYGSYGLGKTHLAGAVAHECIARGIPTVVNTLDSIFRRIRATFSGDAKSTEQQLIDRLTSVPVLIVDDLGKETLSPWSARIFWALVNERYERGLALVGTSNLSCDKYMSSYAAAMKAGDEHISGSTLDRLEEMLGEWVEVSGTSYRMNNKSPGKVPWQA